MDMCSLNTGLVTAIKHIVFCNLFSGIIHQILILSQSDSFYEFTFERFFFSHIEHRGISSLVE